MVEKLLIHPEPHPERMPTYLVFSHLKPFFMDDFSLPSIANALYAAILLLRFISGSLRRQIDPFGFTWGPLKL
jgi:hypothetical protein